MLERARWVERNQYLRSVNSGFTLIEILLVLVLLSVTAVAVIATIPTNSKDVAKKYAQSFYQRIQLLNEEAILSGEEVEGTLEYFLVHTISFGIMELVKLLM